MDEMQSYSGKLVPSSFDDVDAFDRLAWEGAVAAARRDFGDVGCADTFLDVLWTYVRSFAELIELESWRPVEFTGLVVRSVLVAAGGMCVVNGVEDLFAVGALVVGGRGSADNHGRRVDVPLVGVADDGDDGSVVGLAAFEAGGWAAEDGVDLVAEGGRVVESPRSCSSCTRSPCVENWYTVASRRAIRVGVANMLAGGVGSTVIEADGGVLAGRLVPGHKGCTPVTVRCHSGVRGRLWRRFGRRRGGGPRQHPAGALHGVLTRAGELRGGREPLDARGRVDHVA
jgi:hypothetical protein